jgi:hypothetical protein
MSKLALVTPDGVPVTINERPSEVEKHQEEEPFDVMAARSAEQQSTPTKRK